MKNIDNAEDNIFLRIKGNIFVYFFIIVQIYFIL